MLIVLGVVVAAVGVVHVDNSNLVRFIFLCCRVGSAEPILVTGANHFITSVDPHSALAISHL